MEPKHEKEAPSLKREHEGRSDYETAAKQVASNVDVEHGQEFKEALSLERRPQGTSNLGAAAKVTCAVDVEQGQEFNGHGAVLQERFAENILCCEVTLSQWAEKKKKKNEESNQSAQEKIVEKACALLNSGGGVLILTISDHEKIIGTINNFRQLLDTFWQTLEERLANMVKPSTYGDVFDRCLVGSEEILLFINAPQHLCTMRYNLHFAGDARIYEASFIQVVDLLQNLGSCGIKSLNNGDCEYDVVLSKLRERCKYGECIRRLESQQIQLKDLSRKESILADHHQRQMVQKPICAFANTSGGILLLGITDYGKIIGVNAGKEEQDNVTRKVIGMIEHMTFPITPERKVHWDIEFIPVSDCGTLQDRVVVAIKVALTGGVFMKDPESYELSDHDSIQFIQFHQWKQRMLSGPKLQIELKGSGFNDFRYNGNILCCEITLSQQPKEEESNREESNQSPQDKILERACALLNSGGGVLKIAISDHEKFSMNATENNLWQRLDKFWQTLDERLANMVKPSTYGDVFDRCLVGSEEIRLFINAPQHLCTMHYNLCFAGDAKIHEASFIQVVELLQNLGGCGKKSLKNGDCPNMLPKLPERLEYGECFEYHVSKQIQLKYFSGKGAILANHGQRQRVQKWICAFANTSGGIILLGITEYGKIVGVNAGKEEQDNITRKVIGMIEHMTFPITPERKVHWDIEFIPVSDCGTLQDRVVVAIKVAWTGGVFMKDPESYELSDHDAIQFIQFRQWKQRMLSGPKLQTELKGSGFNDFRYDGNILCCEITLSQQPKEEESNREESNQSPQDKILERACALLNSGGGVLKIAISDHEKFPMTATENNLWQRLDKFWQTLEERLANMVKPSIYGDVFDHCLVGSEEMLLFINAPQHFCTMHYNLHIAGDARIHEASFIQVVELLQNSGSCGKKSLNDVDCEYNVLSKLRERCKYGESFGHLESKQIQLKHFRGEGSILANHRQRQSVQRTICAFANTSGGVLLLGITDYGKIVGVDAGKEVQDNITRKVIGMIEHMTFPITPERKGHWDIEFIPVSGCDATQDRAVVAIQVARIGGVFMKDPESYELSDHDAIQLIKFDQWKQRMLSGPELQIELKGQEEFPVMPNGFYDCMSKDEQDIILEIKKRCSSHTKSRGRIVASKSLRASLRGSPCNDVICDLLVISTGLGGLHLYTVCKEGKEEGCLQYSKEVSRLLKTSLVRDGGCSVKFYISSHTCSISKEVESPLPNKQYPQGYDLEGRRRDLYLVLKALVIVVRETSVTTRP